VSDAQGDQDEMCVQAGIEAIADMLRKSAGYTFFYQYRRSHL
jgi:hypothetical protein